MTQPQPPYDSGDQPGAWTTQPGPYGTWPQQPPPAPQPPKRTGLIVGLSAALVLAVVTLVVVLLAGEGDDAETPQAAPVATSSSAPSSSAPSSSAPSSSAPPSTPPRPRYTPPAAAPTIGSDSMVEQAFREVVLENGIAPRYGTADEAVELGKAVCDFYDRGIWSSSEEPVRMMRDSGFTEYDARFFLGLSIGAFCPQHADEL
jgi:hypothetical protein